MSIHFMLWDQYINNFIPYHQHETKFGINQEVSLFYVTDMKSDFWFIIWTKPVK
jgi:hypothetical protein